MIAFRESDLAIMLADSPHRITIGTVTRPCEFAEFDEAVEDGMGGAAQLVHQVVATVRTSDFPAAKGGDSCTVDGVVYKVWQRRQLGDGALTELLLKAGA